ncbi:MAG: hypothetical protein IPG64_14265 [Haliea sp.]|nr:hypothetical protein [Haliea sp.]
MTKKILVTATARMRFFTSSKQTWLKHAVAADVFSSRGRCQFCSESVGRKRHADKVMHELHPDYDALISDFIQSDSLYDLRRNVDAVRLRKNPAESTAIFEEHFQYNRTLLERIAENRRVALSEQEQRQNLEKMLGCCRKKFEATDSALADAQTIVDNLKDELKNLHEQLHKTSKQRQILEALLGDCRKQFEETDHALAGAQTIVDNLKDELKNSYEQFHITQSYAEQLSEHIRNMERSRSWRYTAWLRRS